MVARIGFVLLVGLAWILVADPTQAVPDPFGLDLAAEAVDRTQLQPADIALLDNPKFKWKHLQTEHFVLHYDQKMFAAKVARLGEQFYTAISADLPVMQDRISPARSHIFIFRDSRDWQAIVANSASLQSWVASVVHGHVMWLQETGTATSDQMDTLAHEMTHLVFNRFLPVRLPLWLNEGLAEYYEEFAYRAAKGMGQSRGNAFRPLKSWVPLDELLQATAYPVEPAAANQFYVTGKYLTGFLLLKLPREKWDLFFARLLAGEPALATLLETYGWPDIAALEKDFAAFAR